MIVNLNTYVRRTWFNMYQLITFSTREGHKL